MGLIGLMAFDAEGGARSNLEERGARLQRGIVFITFPLGC
jgi:hypothetical protein